MILFLFLLSFLSFSSFRFTDAQKNEMSQQFFFELFSHFFSISFFLLLFLFHFIFSLFPYCLFHFSLPFSRLLKHNETHYAEKSFSFRSMIHFLSFISSLTLSLLFSFHSLSSTHSPLTYSFSSSLLLILDTNQN